MFRKCSWQLLSQHRRYSQRCWRRMRRKCPRLSRPMNEISVSFQPVHGRSIKFPTMLSHNPTGLLYGLGLGADHRPTNYHHNHHHHHRRRHFRHRRCRRSLGYTLVCILLSLGRTKALFYFIILSLSMHHRSRSWCTLFKRSFKQRTNKCNLLHLFMQ